MKTKRRTAPDMARGIGVVLVLLSHLDTVNAGVLTWISTFHMPLFFVLAGITMSLGRSEGTLRERQRRRARSLLIPYASFSFLYFLMDIVNLSLGKIDGRRFLENALASLTFCGKSILWFVTALLLSQLLWMACEEKLRDARLRGAAVLGLAAVSLAGSVLWHRWEARCGASLAWLPLLDITRSLLRAGVVLPFVAVGSRCAGAIAGEPPSGRKRLFFLAGAVAALAVSIVLSRYHWSDTNHLVIGNPILYYAGGLAGSAAVLCFSAALPGIAPLCRIGQHSLVILAVHMDLYVMWAGMQPAKVLRAVYNADWLFNTVTVLDTLVLGSVIAWGIERWTPFLLRGREAMKPRREHT